jgi:hypothetical protein
MLATSASHSLLSVSSFTGLLFQPAFILLSASFFLFSFSCLLTNLIFVISTHALATSTSHSLLSTSSTLSASSFTGSSFQPTFLFLSASFFLLLFSCSLTMLRFLPPYAYDTTYDSYQTLGLLTPCAYRHSVASRWPSPFMYNHLLHNDVSLCTCSLCLWLCCLDHHVYKRPTGRLRNSKRVLFCTNTSRRRTCPFLIL